MDLDSIFDKIEYLQNNSYDFVAIYPYGSMNYNLDVKESDGYEYKSDVDTVAFVLPSLEDVIRNRMPVSKTIVMDNDDHIDVKDIRLMLELFKKANPSYLELLYSACCGVDNYCEYKDKFLKKIGSMKEDIVFMNPKAFLNAMLGTMYQKQKNMFKTTTNYGEEVEKYGYSSKDYHHIKRYERMLYIIGNQLLGYEPRDFKRALYIDDVNERDYLLSIKCTPGLYGKDYVEKDVKTIMTKAKDYVLDLTYRGSCGELDLSFKDEKYKQLEDAVYDLVESSIIEQIKATD